MNERTVSTGHVGEGVARVTIERPQVRNALDAATAAALADAIEAAGATARAVILTGAGDAFCAGGDLDEIQEWSLLDPAEIATTLYATFQRMIRAIRSSPAVVIAALPGPAVGAGLDLALACDLRVASEGVKLGQVWVKLGLIPGTGGAYLTQALVGPGRAADLLLTGRIVTAEEALGLGLVNRVVPSERLMDEALELASTILSNPAGGVVANKEAMTAATDQALEAALAHAAEVQAARFVSDEFRRAVRDARS